ncbi:MAG: follicular epithelium yolk protein subunit [Nitrococcus mobilis]|nr:follicular epithelium yolk protein subunit [Nitrococcus mobilis]
MGISISIVAGQDKSASSVNASGTVQHVITDEEQTTFRLGDKQLKDAVKAYFGKSPNDAYLHSPTPWGDLYKKYSWPQVQMILVVQSAEILGITSEPVIVKTQEFVNNSRQKGTFNVAITESVNNTTSSNWSTGGTLTIGQKFSYGVKFLGAGAEGETSLSYSQSWGVGGQESKSITVGSSSGVSVELDPGESVLAELSASRGVMKVRIRYNAYLIGNTAVNYNPTYKDHHFWSLGIAGVMAKGGITNSVQSTEDIEIGYYSNSKIELKDKTTGALKAAYSMADAPGQSAAESRQPALDEA